MSHGACAAIFDDDNPVPAGSGCPNSIFEDDGNDWTRLAKGYPRIAWIGKIEMRKLSITSAPNRHTE